MTLSCYARLAAYMLIRLFELTLKPIFMAQKNKDEALSKAKKAVLKKINYFVAGIDLSSQDMYIAIVEKNVRTFSTFTVGLKQAAQYLKAENIQKIVMEATGIYWIPVFEYFEKEGFAISLVNGAHAKNVPGRKTDVLDSEWLRELHTYGLLRGSFIPDQQIRELRYYVRLRDDHISMGATHINLIQKNLDMMNQLFGRKLQIGIFIRDQTSS